MNEKFRNKYRIKSTRFKYWNYAWPGTYFVTICTKNKIHFFGEIRDRKMHINKIGKLAIQEWKITPELRPDMNLELGQFVIMPNHFHAIIIIGKNEYNTNNKMENSHSRDAMHRVSTTRHNIPTNQFGSQSKNLASIIRGFKSSVTKQTRVYCPEFAWQPRFHDHIIRDQKSYQNISNYIIRNPFNWKEDQFF